MTRSSAPEAEIPCRIYAPVGSHEDLLAYLVRRLLENGANTSFVNRIVDERRQWTRSSPIPWPPARAWSPIPIRDSPTAELFGASLATSQGWTSPIRCGTASG